MSHSPPLIDIRNVFKTYHLGDVDLPVLKDVSLEIHPGEFVALMGASGSGKTTLMNLLGCLDTPSSGSYKLDGVEVTSLSRPQLARLRSGRIGFIFQSFNLLARTTAIDNVRMPTSYVDGETTSRQVKRRAEELLESVNLAQRVEHTPAQLSGGEQQRVAIARSLINRPILLLADEPTGNLDSQTGAEILALFRRLTEEQGITLLLVTHDSEVARHADRVIRMKDGRIVDDTTIKPLSASAERRAADQSRRNTPGVGATDRGSRGSWRIFADSVGIAFQAQRRNLLRSALTMLGVIIGVAAVISMMEISQGASSAIEVTVANMGANSLVVLPAAPRPGSGGVPLNASVLSPLDADLIARECPHVTCAAPVVWAPAHLVYGNRDWRPGYIVGSTPSFLIARNWTDVELGRVFTDREVASGAKVCMLGTTIVRELFGDENPVGREIRVQNEPMTVIGVLSSKGANLLGTDQDDIFFAPWTTVKYRISGGGSIAGRGPNASGRVLGPTLLQRLPSMGARLRTEGIEQILVQAKSAESMPAAMADITRLLRERRHVTEVDQDFRVQDMAEVSNALEKTVALMSGLGLSVAAVSLAVGGVGIMNIMLVSVTERTREIGLRMAVGANANDILRQFLVEAVVLCLIGGMIGILMGRGASMLVGVIMNWPTEPSLMAAAVAVAVSVVTGVTFGYYPAWKASRLNPIESLRYE